MELPKSIKETQKALKEKKYSALQLVNAYIERIKKKDGQINSFITLTEEEAFEEAKKVDQLISDLGEKAFEQFPLLGVVVAHKDIFLTKGIRTTAASKVLENYIPPYSASVVEKLSEAGVITLGKLNCDAWAHGSSGENSDFGPTKNPWDKTRVSGGSSSGSAAAVASGFCLASTGTDTGGSIRMPASFCGLVGLKPTYGAVSRYGVIAMASSLDSVGHITRTAEDSRKIFRLTRGEDGKDATVKAVNYQTSKVRSLGIPKEYFQEGLDRQVEKALSEALKVFKAKGIKLVDISLPHTKYAISAYYIIQPAEVSSNLARYDGIRFGKNRKAFSDEAKRRLMLGTFVLSSGYYEAYYNKAMKVRARIIEDFNEAYKKVEAIIAPVSPNLPFKLGEKVNDPLSMYLADILAVSANLAGIPALSLPGGFSKEGLPIGFQLMGPRFAEESLFSLAQVYQEEATWHLKEATL